MRRASPLTKARKAHRCDLCRHHIEKDELYSCQPQGPWDGSCDEARTVRYCQFCAEAWARETKDWTRDDYENCTCPSDVLAEYVHALRKRLGVAEEYEAAVRREKLERLEVQRAVASWMR